jgi:DNA (cytosine-5)-methyltransferase 1
LTNERITVVDLFAGAGGLSTGIATACEDLGLEPGTDVELHAVNHWEPAIATHERNHPWANHYHSRIEQLYPPDVVDPDNVDLLAGGPSCTHFSSARGGKPVKDQKRAPAWHVLDWVEKLRPDHILLENVPDFRSWSRIEDGKPTNDGAIFERWCGMLEALGYTVLWDDDAEDYGTVLNAADYGDPQSRERLFIMAARDGRPTVPEPTHDDNDPDKPDRRPAADIIDWSHLGSSLWTRDLENALVQPLAQNTVERIAEGIRRHCDSRLEPFADALAEIGPDRLEALREMVVPARYAEEVAAAVDKPFLVRLSGHEATAQTPSVVKNYGTSHATPIDSPLDTVTSGGWKHALMAPQSFVMGQHSNSLPRPVNERPAMTVACGGKLHLPTLEAFCLRQQSGGVPVPIDDPLSTVSGKGAIGLTAVEGRPLIQPKNGPQRGNDSNPLYPAFDRPLNTVTSDPRAKLVAPFLVKYYGNSDVQGVDVPLGTVTKKDRFALCVPELWPYGLDVHYRMLRPDELKQAQGFPADYEIVGDTKSDVKEQIGNAVPVNLARALTRHLLGDQTPSLATYGAGATGQPDAEVPSYEEVAQGDD